MRILYIVLFTAVLMTSAGVFSQSVSTEVFSIRSLKNSDSGKIFKAVLKLKTVDYNFLFAEFYDADNIDLRFDLTDYYKKRKFKPYRKLDNIHHGALYTVEFKLLSVDENTGHIQTEFIDYSPLFLDRLP